MNQLRNNTTESIRVFIALVLPPQAKEVLTRTICALAQETLTGVRWVYPSRNHLTLGRVREGVPLPGRLQIGKVVSEAKLEPTPPRLVVS